MEAQSSHTHLSRLPGMLWARLPLSDHALQLAGDSPAATNTQQQQQAALMAASPLLSDTTHAEGREILKGMALHVRLHQESVIISILHL